MHEISELVQVAAPMATVGGVAVIARVIRAREARRSRMAGELVRVEAEALVVSNSNEVRMVSDRLEPSQDPR
jgi:hypothetical protein